ncbi:efflux RND transporter periplasmic adaptor subunit [Methylobacterium sp. WL9]|uniref:efflux RND transporter periplasmic adaptor subunit n=1 Tax=Methylobacterium sp. WL9 TaxID=2603898 RepID=UPI0011CCA0A0|nr:efflux RND transporter periplasmic adaptor subunit [Methylobacterium sp. WL9]TXN24022.1 efflux RND transporter periplasmic adaptor subunit [Methylobacterium sp. WL9]
MRSGLGFVVAGALIATAGVGGGVWWAAGHPIPNFLAEHFHTTKRAEKPERDDPRIDVRVVQASQQSVPIAFEYTGTIISPADAELQARVSGKVMERSFEPGGHVRKGQLLFKIDPRPFEVALQTAKAQQGQAKAALEFAQAELSRTEQLVEKGYASEQRNQQNQSNLAGALGKLQEAEAAIARQELNLNYAEVNAPFDGRSSLSLVNTGDMVIENQTNLVSVVQVDPIDVQLALSSEDVEAVRQAMHSGAVKVQLLDERRKPVREATIYKLDNRFDPRTARRLVQAKVENKDERYLPGQFVRARVEVGRQERLLVPTIALSSQLDQQVVWTVAEDGTVHMIPIETGDVYGENTAIVSGLKPGVQVAVDHLQGLRQNLKVNPRAGGEVSAIADEPAQGEARH